MLRDLSFFEEKDSCVSDVVCSLFKLPARNWYGIFRRDWSQRNKFVLLTRFHSRLYELPLLAVGLGESLLSLAATVKIFAPC